MSDPRDRGGAPPTPPPVQDCVEGYVHVRAPLRFLLLKRTEPRGGFWQPVSGRVEPHDLSLESAVRREVAEETGFRSLCSVSDLHWQLVFPGKDGRPWRVHAFGVEVPEERPPVLSYEHERFRWCRPEEALSTLFWPDNREALRTLRMRLGI